MESSQIYGVTEECNSCESGWTMYIGSPIHNDDGSDDDDNNQHSDDGDNDDDGGAKNYNHEDDSNDSMASDASSGPSHQGMAHSKHEEDKLVGKYRLEMKAKKPLMEKEKAKMMRRKEEKEEMVFKEKRAKAPAQTGSKVRKNIRMGKRK